MFSSLFLADAHMPIDAAQMDILAFDDTPTLFPISVTSTPTLFPFPFFLFFFFFFFVFKGHTGSTWWFPG